MSDLSSNYLDSNDDWQRIYLVYADDLDISSYTSNSYYDFSVQERDSDVYQDDASVSDDTNNIYPIMPAVAPSGVSEKSRFFLPMTTGLMAFSLQLLSKLHPPSLR